MLKQKLNSNDVYIFGNNGPVVSSASKNIVPTGTKSITENGTGIDVTNYASADVNVQPNVDTKSITANGIYNASSDNLDGYSQVTVNVPSSATGTIDITENANGINVSTYEYANVNVHSPSYVKNPIEFDYNIGYVDKDSNNYGIWRYESPTNTYTDIYTIENGKTYLIGFGATVSTRARGCITQTDVRTLGPGSQTTGEAPFVGIYSGTVNPGNVWRFTAPFDGYFIFAKSNNGISGVQSYFYCVNNMTDAEPSGTKTITENGDGIDVAGYSAVNVNVPGTTPPSGTITITQNGTGIDIAQYAYADVAVPGVVPTGSLSITNNGTYDVTNYASAVVNVSGGGQLPSDTTVTAIQISEDSHDIVIPYDSQRIPMMVLGEPIVLSGTRYECSSFFLKRNFITGDFNQIAASYINYNKSDDGLFIGSNGGKVVLDETNHTITMTVKNTSYWFYANDVFNVFIMYANAS